MKLAIVYGTRPEIIKLSAIIRLAKQMQYIDMICIHTGQHYSYNMDKKFIDDLKLPEPDVNLHIGSGTQAYQIGTGLIKLEEIFLEEKPDIIMAEGDTNAVLSAAITSAKLHIPFAHVEAGIRSFDRYMPEEINRIIADQIARYCFVPTKTAVKNLKMEGIYKNKVYLTGNTIVETVQENLKLAERSNILNMLAIKREKYVVLTAHRVENVENEEMLLKIIDALEQIKERIIFPIHPRTLKKLEELDILGQIENMKNVQLIEPVGYFDFLKLCANSKLIITDSGGVQEECTIYKKPIIVIRDNTERPEILETFGWLTGCDTKKIIEKYDYITANYEKLKIKLKHLKSPFGDGKASNRILAIISEKR